MISFAVYLSFHIVSMGFPTFQLMTANLTLAWSSVSDVMISGDHCAAAAPLSPVCQQPAGRALEQVTLQH